MNHTVRLGIQIRSLFINLWGTFMVAGGEDGCVTTEVSFIHLSDLGG